MGHMYHPACDKSTSHGGYPALSAHGVASPSHLRPLARYAVRTLCMSRLLQAVDFCFAYPTARPGSVSPPLSSHMS